MAYWESNGQVIDNVTKGQTRDPIRLEPNISKTAGDAIWKQSLITR